MRSLVQTFMKLPHRRPAFGVNAPAAFMHLAYRIDESLEATDYETATLKKSEFIAELNDRLRGIQAKFNTAEVRVFRNVAEDSVAKRAAEGIIDAQERAIDSNSTLLNELMLKIPRADGDLSGWRIRLRVDVHAEYYSMTFILDQDDEPAPLSSGAMKAVSYEKLLSDRERRKLDATKAENADAREIIKFLYEDIWDEFERELDGSRLPDSRKFAEFRSIALRDHTSRFAIYNKAHEGARGEIVLTGNPRHDTNFDDSRYGLRTWVSGNNDLVNEILKFNQLTGGIDRDANCVLCEVMHGGAIYGSSLGQSPAAGGDESSAGRPLRYFIVCNDLSKYQLGRLIRRHHVLGELRMAATFDIREIAIASNKIRSLGSKIDEELKAVTLPVGALRSFQSELNIIHSSIDPGGLSYRVSRSRYYAKAFRERVEELRIGRLEGWEPYDDFIKRNLYQVFDFISGVGERYVALAERISRLTQAHNAERLNGFQGEMQNLVTEMKDLTVEINDVQKEVLYIQTLGEAIGIAAFAYYAGHIIAMALKIAVKFGCEHCYSERDCEDFLRRGAEGFEIFGVVVALGLLPHLWGWWRRRREAEMLAAKEAKAAKRQPRR